ncbi:senescence marker protein-30 (SMP-30) family protein [Labrys miyagiensis]
MLKRQYDIQVVKSAGNLVGESPLWHPLERALYWVDTRRPSIQRLGADGAFREWAMPNRLGTIALRRGGGLVAGTKRGFVHFDPSDGSVTTIADPEAANPEHRLNDGKIDRRGRYWCVSTGSSEEDPGGSLFRLDPDLSCHRMDTGYILGNGLAFSPDDRTMIVGDTNAGLLYAYDFDLDAGQVSNRRPFFSSVEMPWQTDGGTFDSEGFYWCALIFDGAIGRFDPTGRLDRLLRLPVSTPTMCSFGGDDLDILYVTSGSIFLSEEQRAREPEAGSIFAIRNHGVRGVPESWFGQGDASGPSERGK